MNIERLKLQTTATIPLIAALPYWIDADPPLEGPVGYDPVKQLTSFSGRNFSTSRYDESAGGIFSSRSDTKKDD